MRRKFSEKYLLDDPSWEGPKKYIYGLKNRILRLLTLICCLFIVSSCFEEGDCLITNSTLVKVSLKDLDTKKDTTLTFLSITTLEGKEIYGEKALSKLELPVNPGETETSFVFVQGAKKDTLTIHYTNETVVLSPDCGAYEFQKDLKAIKNTLGADSIKWINNQLFKSITVNAEIYY